MFLETFVNSTCGLAGVRYPAGALIPLFQRWGCYEGMHSGCAGVYGGGAARSEIYTDART